MKITELGIKFIKKKKMFSNTSTAMTASQPEILPYQSDLKKVLFIMAHIWPVIISFGLISNTINIIVFLKSGVRDNVTILLLCLSVSDFCFLLLMTPRLATVLIRIFVPNWDWKFDFTITAHLFYWPAVTMYDFSAYLSVFLGITRCACVALPLHFKSMFTKSRTVICVVALFISTVLLRIPVLTIHSIGIKLNPLTNHSYAFLVKHGSPTKVLVNDTLIRTSLPWVAFIIMVACVIILSVKLVEASKVRQPTTSASSETNEKPDDRGQQSSSKHKMSARETHVVQSVVLVCVIFILSQLPFLLYSTARLIHPEFDVGKKFQYLLGISSQMSLTCSFLNASVNIFIYFNYNSKYRSIVESMIVSLTNTKSKAQSTKY